MSRNIVVTGGSGFIGSHLCTALALMPDVERIFVLDVRPPALALPKVEHVEVDLRKPLEWCPPVPITTCFHLAAVCREPGYPWDDYFGANYLGTRTVVDWAERVGIQNIVFTSTVMVFQAGEACRSEADLPNADTGYGISKALAEEVLRAWRSRDAHRRLRVVRPGVVFGCRGGGNYVSLYRALKRNLFCYVGRSSTIKSSIYVKDLVRLLLAVETDRSDLDTFHGVYPAPTTIRAICEAFSETYGWRRFIPVLPMKLLRIAALPFQAADAVGLRNPVHYRRIEKLYYSTHLSAANLATIGFQAQYTLAEAIRDWRKDCRNLPLY
jgi:GlcNAc-P-P-Und epimerase